MEYFCEAFGGGENHGITAVCINCERLRRGYKWTDKKATAEEFKITGRVICSECRPKNDK